MDDVKPVHRYKAQTMFSFGGAKIEYFPHGPEVVLATEFDAQRLRADTAEAERDDLKNEVGQVKGELICANEKLAAAEQRIAELVAAIETYLKGTGNSPGSNRRHAELRAALNPKPEAGSHDA